MSRIRIAIAAVGHGASSLVQGRQYYRDKSAADAIGLMHWTTGGYGPSHIEQAGRDVAEAIVTEPR